MPIPIIDAAQALKASPEKTEDALLKVKVHICLHGGYELITELLSIVIDKKASIAVLNAKMVTFPST